MRLARRKFVFRSLFASWAVIWVCWLPESHGADQINYHDCRLDLDRTAPHLQLVRAFLNLAEFAAQNHLISADEIQRMALNASVTNPLIDRAQGGRDQVVFRGFADIIKKTWTAEQWQICRVGLAALSERVRAGEQTRSKARREAALTLRARLITRIYHNSHAMHWLKTDGPPILILQGVFAQPYRNLGTQGGIRIFSVQYSLSRDSSVQVDQKTVMVVGRQSNYEVHLFNLFGSEVWPNWASPDNWVTPVLHRLPDGQLLMAYRSQYGPVVLNVSDADHPIQIPLVGDPARSRANVQAQLFTDSIGRTFLLSPYDPPDDGRSTAEIYGVRLSTFNGREFVNPVDLPSPARLFGNTIEIIEASNGHFLVGIRNRQEYLIYQIDTHGKWTSPFHIPMGDSAKLAFYTSRSGVTYLAANSQHNGKEAILIFRPLISQEPMTIFPLPRAESTAVPHMNFEWFETASGRAMLAVAIADSPSLLFEPGSSTPVLRLGRVGGFTRPAATTLPDGRVLLAVSESISSQAVYEIRDEDPSIRNQSINHQ